MKRASLLLPALALASCMPAVTTQVSDALLSAQARTPYGTFNFHCNPAQNAQRAGAVIVLNGEQNAISCPSQDGKATLVLNIYSVRTPSQWVSVNTAPDGQPAVFKNVQVDGTTIGPITQVVLLLSPTGDAPLAFVGNAEQARNDPYIPILKNTRGGSFTATLSSGVTVQGVYNLTLQPQTR